jgi:CubicO group peptidase (beta-lactamase class C family)
MRFLGALCVSVALASCATVAGAGPAPRKAAIDAEAHRAMQATGARGLAVALIDRGRVVHVASYGVRNEAGDPLRTDTIMYGASVTKAVFAYMVAQLVDEGVLELDQPIGAYLDRPLPSYTGPEIEDLYARWSDLAGDERWRKLTPRILLTHSAGFANFGFMEPDGKLRFHFEPGARYAYSGEGYILLQFILERGLGRDLEADMQARVFRPLGMTRTSLKWREDFAADNADGWTLDGRAIPHDERSAPRAAGSMDTTIGDMARFAAALVRGDRLGTGTRRELFRPQVAITTRSQFPTLQPELPEAERRRDLYAALGVTVFEGPQGPAFVRGGHNDSTGNTMVCVMRAKRCAVLMSNDVRGEAAFSHLVDFLLGDTGAPWAWNYPDVTFWDGS